VTVDDEATTTSAVGDAETTTAATAPARPGPVRQFLRLLLRHLGVVLLTVALLGSAGLAAGVYFLEYRPAKQVDDEVAQTVLEAAKQGMEALLSYSPESFERDFATAKEHLTGDFLSYYTNFTEQIVTPAVKQKQVKTSAAVVRSAVEKLEPDKAVVLVFVNQVTTSKENPDGAFQASSVKVGLEKIDGRWLISEFTPV
jgi:Mce-associated membrane protein